jgi:hypothetical protein
MNNIVVKPKLEVESLPTNQYFIYEIYKQSNLANLNNLSVPAYKEWLWKNICAATSNSSEIKTELFKLLSFSTRYPNKVLTLICDDSEVSHGETIIECLNWLRKPTLTKIISGGQYGADLAGLQAAKELGIPTGGTAPKHYRVCLPDGADSTNPELKDYGLVESHSYEYRPRTIKNVVDSDGTVWFGYDKSPGGYLTISTCRKHSKPCLINPSAIDLFYWVKTKHITTLNVAGNRVSDLNPDIVATTFNTIKEAFRYTT